MEKGDKSNRYGTRPIKAEKRILDFSSDLMIHFFNKFVNSDGMLFQIKLLMKCMYSYPFLCYIELKLICNPT